MKLMAKEQISISVVTGRLGRRFGLRGAGQRESFLLALRGLCGKQFAHFIDEERGKIKSGSGKVSTIFQRRTAQVWLMEI